MGLELSQRARRVGAAGLGVAGVLMLSGCSSEDVDQIKRLAMPVPSTLEADSIYDLWRWAWLAAILVGIVVWGLILFAVIKYRRRSESEVPVQTRYNLPIEIFYTVAPIMMVIVFFFFTVKAQNDSLHVYPNPDHDVTVVGQQWSWTFNYRNEPAVDGTTVYDVGTPAEPPTLYLVKDQSVNFKLFSPDVIHSFWVPAFLFKMDVVPGRDNGFGITPDRSGTFEGRCAELCGVYHSRMLFKVKVVSQSDYDAHLRDLAAQGNTGLNLGAGNTGPESGYAPDAPSADALATNGGEQ